MVDRCESGNSAQPSPHINTAGIDPHQTSFTVGIVDPNGIEIHHESFDNTAQGFIEAIDMLTAHSVETIGVEGSAKWGAHISIALVAAGFDCREIPPQRTAISRQIRRLDKTDAIDAVSSSLNFKCRRGDSNPHGISPTSPSS